MQTIAELFFESIERYPKRDRFLVHSMGVYKLISTIKFTEQVLNLAGWLLENGFKQGDRVAILSYNRLEWAVCDYAANIIGCPVVPIYTTVSEPQIEYILKDSESKIIFVENEQLLAKIQSIRKKLPQLKGVRLISSFYETKKIFRLDDAIKISEKIDQDSISTIIYTSGTTGEPKGVMLSHKNLVSNILACSEVVPIYERDVGLSFLPLSHVFQRIVDYILFYRGATIAYATDIKEVAENLSRTRPTIMSAVPSFFEKFYQQITQEVSRMHPVKRWIFDLAAHNRVARMVVHKKIRQRIGGRIRFFISGGAALSPQVAEFFAGLEFKIIEGYGLTETSPVVSVNPINKIKIGTVGKPIPGVEVKIADDGEILVRGPNVMLGYLNKPKETRDVIKDGWLYTGDIGEIERDGYLVIKERKKELFKTTGGKYIAPQPIETRLRLSRFIRNAIVIADNRKFPVCLIVPNFDNLRRELKINARDVDLINHPSVQTLIQSEVDKVNDSLSQPEKIKKFALVVGDFTIESGELTPTMKPKRRVIEQKYRALIDSLYA